MTFYVWGFAAVALIVLGPPAVHLVHGALTGKRPSAAEVAAAEMAATPAHPALRHPGLPRDGRPLDEDEQRRLDAVERDSWSGEDSPRVPQQRGRS